MSPVSGESSAVLVIDRDLEGAQEAVILGSEFDLAGGFKRALGLFDYFGLVLFLVFGVLIPPVKTDSRFQHQENVITGSFDFPDCLCNPVGFGEGIVNRVSQLLHEVLQWFFHRFPLMADAPETTGVPPTGPHPPVPIVVDQTGVHKRVPK